MADTQSILQLGIEAARSGDKAEARELFRLVTREDPQNSQGWLWLAGVAEDREEKRSALERVLQIDPSNDLARKGLAALGGARAARPAAATPPPASAPASTSDQELVDSFDSIDSYAPPPSPTRARIYDQPEPVGAYVPADFSDDYDLSEYQEQPIPAMIDDNDRDTTVVVEDEEPHRRGGGWWLPLLALLAVAAIVLIVIFALGGNDTDESVAETSAEPAASTESDAVVTAPVTATDSAGLIEGSPAPSGDALASADATASDVASSEAAPSDVTSPEASPSDAAPGESTGPDTGVVPPEASPDVASPAPAASTPVASTPAEASPPAEEPAASPDVASANPAIVGNDQVLAGGNFEYTYSGISNVTSGSYGGALPARGRYLIVLMAVRNTSDQPQQIPDDFFVVKDAQGRTATFNRAASVDYINRFGGTGPRGAGDYAADATLPPGAPLGSMPLLFDVAGDATDLVVFSRDNLNQGFLVRQNVQ